MTDIYLAHSQSHKYDASHTSCRRKEYIFTCIKTFTQNVNMTNIYISPSIPKPLTKYDA